MESEHTSVAYGMSMSGEIVIRNPSEAASEFEFSIESADFPLIEFTVSRVTLMRFRNILNELLALGVPVTPSEPEDLPF